MHKEDNSNIIIENNVVYPEHPDLIQNEFVLNNIIDELKLNVDDVGYQREENQIKTKRKYNRKNPEQKILRKRSPEHNQKISKALAGRTLSETHKQNIAQSMIGNNNGF